MKPVILVLNEGPGRMKTSNALLLAHALAGQKLPLRIFLLDDAVYLARKGKTTGLSDLLDLGLPVYISEPCARARGLTGASLLPGVIMGSMVDLATSVATCKQVLSF